jgi:Activator of Hsp90 ATPase homolog 1-like protein
MTDDRRRFSSSTDATSLSAAIAGPEAHSTRQPTNRSVCIEASSAAKPHGRNQSRRSRLTLVDRFRRSSRPTTRAPLKHTPRGSGLVTAGHAKCHGSHGRRCRDWPNPASCQHERGTVTISSVAAQLSRMVEASPQRVFEAMTDPEQVAKWWGPERFTCPEVTLALRVGGAYRMESTRPDVGQQDHRPAKPRHYRRGQSWHGRTDENPRGDVHQ